MRICMYERHSHLGRVQRLGMFFNNSTIIDVNLVHAIDLELKGYKNAQARADHLTPPSLAKLLNTSERPLDHFADIFYMYEQQMKDGVLKTKNIADSSFDLKDDKKARLACPIDEIHCYRDFFTHEKHVKKGFEKRGEPMPEAWYEMPVYYKGATAGFLGNQDEIMWPNYTDKLDFELELACVLASDGFNIKAEHAYEHIFGFTILNDISARDIQRKEMSVRLGPSKGKDFCSILGPIIVTADEFDFKDPDLLMTATINGDEWSRGRSSEAKFSWGEMIEFASREEWLMATDLLGSGTVGTGCGLELDRWIQSGDKIELEIENIGKLTNFVGYKRN
jgi:2-keto-4-pentenoate hydratase/2-oxohepta-3-ene-1,7-dioic acid hydratase in catechol pathway